MIKARSVNKNSVYKCELSRTIEKNHGIELCSWSQNMLLCVSGTPQLLPHLTEELLVCTVFLLQVYSTWLSPCTETTCTRGKRMLSKGSWNPFGTFDSFLALEEGPILLLWRVAGLSLFLEHVLCWAAVCPRTPSVTESMPSVCPITFFPENSGEL